MATRSPTPFHNDWGNQFTAYANLPNVAGSPTQSAALQVGDTAYDTTGATAYICTVQTLGAAVWQAINMGPLTDANFWGPTYIVYNSVDDPYAAQAPGQFSDPGDGSGIAAAITACNAAPGRIHIRSGNYDLRTGAVVLPQITAGAIITGEGPNTVIVAPDDRDQGIFVFYANGARFSAAVNDLQIDVPIPTADLSGTTSTAPIVFASTTSGSSGAFLEINVERTTVVINGDGAPANQKVRASIDFISDNGGLAFENAHVTEIYSIMQGVTDPGGAWDTDYTHIRCIDSVSTGNDFSGNLDVTDCFFTGGQNGVASDVLEMSICGGRYISLTKRGVALSGKSLNSKVDGITVGGSGPSTANGVYADASLSSLTAATLPLIDGCTIDASTNCIAVLGATTPVVAARIVNNKCFGAGVGVLFDSDVSDSIVIGNHLKGAGTPSSGISLSNENTHNIET